MGPGEDRIDKLLKRYYAVKGSSGGEDDAYRRPMKMSSPGTMHDMPSMKSSSAGRIEPMYDNLMPFREKKIIPPTPSDKKPPKPLARECPSFSILGAYIDGVAGKKEKEYVEEHITLCPDCRVRVKSGIDAVQSRKSEEPQIAASLTISLKSILTIIKRLLRRDKHS